MNDHDLLIEIHTTLKNLSESTNRILADHETRIRSSEKSMDISNGIQRNQMKTIRVYGMLGSVATAVLGYLSFNK